MKVLVVFALLVGFCALVMPTVRAHTLNDETLADLERNSEELGIIPDFGEEHNRTKRYTCNVLRSVTACKAHCRILGRRSGYCSSKGICICRR